MAVSAHDNFGNETYALQAAKDSWRYVNGLSHNVNSITTDSSEPKHILQIHCPPEIHVATSSFSCVQDASNNIDFSWDSYEVDLQTPKMGPLSRPSAVHSLRTRYKSRLGFANLKRERPMSVPILDVAEDCRINDLRSPIHEFSPRKRQRTVSIDITSVQFDQAQQYKSLDLFHATSLADLVIPDLDHEACLTRPDASHLHRASQSSLPLLGSGLYTPPDGDHASILDTVDQTRHISQAQAGNPLRNVSVLRRMSIAIGNTVSTAVGRVIPRPRRTSIMQAYEKAKDLQKHMQRTKLVMFLFQYSIYALFVTFIYLVLVGRPIWLGVYWYVYVLFEHDMAFVGGSAIFLGLAFFYAFAPLLVCFQEPAPIPFHRPKFSRAMDTALLIPCHRSANILPATLDAALAIFPACNIFVIANGDSPTPIDNTEEICRRFGVTHVWSPIGSKIVAQYVGTYVAKGFPYILLIDDDCTLPRNFPVATERIRDKVKVVGYIIKSVGARSSRGNYCQQAQDVEYKLSGLQRQFAGIIGSATFPHGAISLWDRRFLAKTFQEHPGFSISEDWFFGHVARTLGSRCVMCSSVFVETETPASVFFSLNASRGGFGEMTVFKQRVERWNFFFVNGIYYNVRYLLFSWKLGHWEVGAKIFVFQEVYETLLYLVTPLVLPVSFLVRPFYTLYLFLGTYCMYLLNSLIFNEVHLRRANEQVDRVMLMSYYVLYKFVLTFINVASTWWSIWKYAEYFAKRHPKIIEDHRAVALVLQIEEEDYQRNSRTEQSTKDNNTDHRQDDSHYHGVDNTAGNPSIDQSRRLTVTAIEVDMVPSSEPNLTMSDGYENIAVIDNTSPDTTKPISMIGLRRWSPKIELQGSPFQHTSSENNIVSSPGAVPASNSAKVEYGQCGTAIKDFASLDTFEGNPKLDTETASWSDESCLWI